MQRIADEKAFCRMQRMRYAIATLSLLCLVFAALAAWAERAADGPPTGTVTGTLTYERDRKQPWRYQRYYVKGRTKGPLAEAVVALVPIGRSPAFSKSRASKMRQHAVNQKDFRFIPETIAIRTGDRVKFTNSDATLHNVHSRSKTHRFDTNLRRGNENIQTFGQAGGTETPVHLRCIFHGSMHAWIYVFDHPYFQVTMADGRFRLSNVPPGKYELIVVHPAGELRTVQQVTVAAGKTTHLDVRVSPVNKVQSKSK